MVIGLEQVSGNAAKSSSFMLLPRTAKCAVMCCSPPNKAPGPVLDFAGLNPGDSFCQEGAVVSYDKR